MNSESYQHQYMILEMAEEIRKLKYIIAELHERGATTEEKPRVWTEEEVLASAGLTYGE